MLSSGSQHLPTWKVLGFKWWRAKRGDAAVVLPSRRNEHSRWLRDDSNEAISEVEVSLEVLARVGRNRPVGRAVVDDGADAARDGAKGRRLGFKTRGPEVVLSCGEDGRRTRRCTASQHIAPRRRQNRREVLVQLPHGLCRLHVRRNG